MSAGSPETAPDQRAELLRATASLHADGGRGRPVTSDLSIDEALLLHAVGWEPVDLVCGVSVASVPGGVWNWGSGEIGSASAAQALAFSGAVSRIADECGRAGGHGVVGVHVDVSVEPHHIDVELVGTAVRPVGTTSKADVFVSDLSGRDFSLLVQAGWRAVGLAYGASFVYAPRRTAGTSLKQTRENVELTNFTEAMYSARELAMERMQQSAITMGGKGIVEVKVTEGPMGFARHAIGFAAWGTAVRLEAATHQYLRPQVVLPLDDAVIEFEAGSLRGG
ncbi:MAG: heavy metal-binding domain-containing protein [Acidimicrobiales bacterium]